jgi:hypothetical protein
MSGGASWRAFFQTHLELATVEAAGVTAQEPYYADDGIRLGLWR